MPKRQSRLKRGNRLLINLRTGDEFSANRDDYWNLMPTEGFDKDIALVELRTVRGKKVVGGFRKVMIKRHPKVGDL